MMAEVGVVLGLIGLGIVFYLSIGWVFGRWIAGRPLFILGTLMVIAGIQLVSLGLLAEMIVCGSSRERDPPVEAVLK